MHIIAVSIGRSILSLQSRERHRMEAYASRLSSLHVIVLTRREHGFSGASHEGNLHVYATNSRTRAGMLWDAFWEIRCIVKKIGRKSVTITSQDPFEIGLMSYISTRLLGIPLHIQIHGDYWSEKWGEGSPLSTLRRILGLFLLKRACGVRVVSHRSERSLIERGVPESKITVLPIRPELERFVGSIRIESTTPGVRFLAMSRFSSEKNIPMLLRAFKKAQQQNPLISLRLVGKGVGEIQIRRMIDTLSLKNTEIIPWTDDVVSEYQNADVFLLSSNHEAYGLTLVEALATGLPVITTDVGCVGDVVADGVHGIVVSVGDEDAYARAITLLVENTALRTRYGAAGAQLGRTLSSQSEGMYVEKWVAAHSCNHTGVY